MLDQEVPIGKVCRLRFSEPVPIRISRANTALVLEIDLVFWRMNYPEALAYRLPNMFVGYLVTQEMLDRIEKLEVIGDAFTETPETCV